MEESNPTPTLLLFVLLEALVITIPLVLELWGYKAIVWEPIVMCPRAESPLSKSLSTE